MFDATSSGSISVARQCVTAEAGKGFLSLSLNGGV